MDGFLAFKSLPCRMNIWHKGYPKPSTSVYTMPDSSMYQAIDGRIWYFPEITNRWTTEGSASSMDWFALDFGTAHEISSINFICMQIIKVLLFLIQLQSSIKMVATGYR